MRHAIALLFFLAGPVFWVPASAFPQTPVSLNEKTVIEFMDGVHPRRPIGCFTNTIVVPNRREGRLRIQMSGVGNSLQVAVLDPNKRKGAYQYWGVSQLSEKQADSLDFTMKKPMPERELYIQLQAYSEGEVQVYLEWDEPIDKTDSPSAVSRGGLQINVQDLLVELKALRKRVEQLERDVDQLKNRK